MHITFFKSVIRVRGEYHDEHYCQVEHTFRLARVRVIQHLTMQNIGHACYDMDFTGQWTPLMTTTVLMMI